MKIVADTNVLVSGLLSAFSPCGQIVRMIAGGQVRLCLDARLIVEYREVLSRPKFQFHPGRIADFLDHAINAAQLVSGVPVSCLLPDPDDSAFVEVAIAAGAECLVTGNLKHFPTERVQGVRVLSPAHFLEYYQRRLTPES